MPLRILQNAKLRHTEKRLREKSVWGASFFVLGAFLLFNKYFRESMFRKGILALR